MWYDDNDNKIKKDRPIFASKDGRICILLPQMTDSQDPCICSYGNTGYNWFDINTGEYNSSKFYKTVEEAINSYSKSSYRIFNGKLKVVEV